MALLIVDAISLSLVKGSGFGQGARDDCIAAFRRVAT